MPRWPLQRSVLALDAFSPLELTQHEFWPSTHHRSLQGDASASGHRVRRIASRPPVKQESGFAFSFSSNRDERQGNRAHYLIVRIESTTGRYGFVLRTTKTVWVLCLLQAVIAFLRAKKSIECSKADSNHIICNVAKQSCVPCQTPKLTHCQKASNSSVPATAPTLAHSQYSLLIKTATSLAGAVART